MFSWFLKNYNFLSKILFIKCSYALASDVEKLKPFITANLILIKSNLILNKQVVLKVENWNNYDSNLKFTINYQIFCQNFY